VDCDPLAALLPDQAPEPVQEVAFLADQVSVELAPLATVLGLAVKVTVGAGEVTDTVADCDALPPVPVHASPKVELAVSAPVDCEPLVALLPDQAPEAVQEVALVADQVNVELAPLATVLGAALKVTVGAAVVTETVADWVALPPEPVQVSV
jgi:antitoxin component HigA of HigAB toxin-antitoxin module